MVLSVVGSMDYPLPGYSRNPFVVRCVDDSVSGRIRDISQFPDEFAFLCAVIFEDSVHVQHFRAHPEEYTYSPDESPAPID